MRIGNRIAYQTNTVLGFSYIGLIIFIAISGIALAGVGIVWSQDQQREREKELLFVGEQFRQAIGSYYENTPSNIKQYPNKLEDLLQDNRLPNLKRHLRKIYNDPITNSSNWGLRSYASEANDPREGDDVYDVYSTSKQVGINGLPYANW